MRETLKHYVKRVMRQKGLSLSDIERSSNKQITASYIGRILKGTVTNLTIEKIVALAQGLEVDPYEIFAASYGKPPESRDHPDSLVLLDVMQKLVMNPDLLEVLQQWLRLSPKERTVLLQPIKFINEPRPQQKKKRN
jgi:transcriptional regulator with XRE-family HTH domain